MPIRPWGPALFLFLLLAWPTGGAWAKAKDTAAAPAGPGFALLERVGSDPLLLWAMRADDLGRARPAFEADIVLADGELVAWPGEPE